MKIIFGSQEPTETFEPQIARLLELLGHPEALITDSSTFLDFISQFEYPTLEEANARLRELLLPENLQVSITANMTFIEAGRAITELHPSWPKHTNIH